MADSITASDASLVGVYEIRVNISVPTGPYITVMSADEVQIDFIVTLKVCELVSL